MLALTVAFVGAVLALLGKIIFDRWELHRQRCSIAAALAGEIGAYMKQLDPTNTTANFRKLATFDHEKRRKRLRSMLKPPQGHPVFDKVADKIGLLPVTEALEVSSIYNVVTGVRLFILGLSSEEMANADDEVQIAILEKVADAIEQNQTLADNLVGRLKLISDQRFCICCA